jgi:apolipoprotein D and lipocalin family protein
MADSNDLDQRIEQAERRLVERQTRLTQEARALTERVQRTVTAKRFVVPAIAGGIGLLWLMLRQRRSAPKPAAVHPEHTPQQTASGGLLTLAVAQLPGLLWPMLPARWRGRTSPATVAAVIGAGLPLLQRIIGSITQDSRSHRLQTVSRVDLSRYAGNWYEVARLPNRFEAACVGQPSARYTPRGNGLEVVNRCPKRGGGERITRGVARVVSGSAGAKLRVSFAPRWLRLLPFVWGDYWIVHLEPDYGAALVGTPRRDMLWLLSRRRELSESTLQRLVAAAHVQGFPVHRLQFS